MMLFVLSSSSEHQILQYLISITMEFGTLEQVMRKADINSIPFVFIGRLFSGNHVRRISSEG